MENNTSFDERQMDGFCEVAEMGLTASAEILSKLLNNKAEFSVSALNQEKIMGLESFGDEPGLAIGLMITGAIGGKAAVVVQNSYVREIINILMSVDEGSDSGDGELDEIAIGTFKELVGQLAASYGDSVTNFFGSAVGVDAGGAEEISEDCGEIADLIGSDIEDEAYSLIVDFSIGDTLSGNFVVVLNEDTMNNTLDRIMGSDSDYDGSDDYDDFGEGMTSSQMGNVINAAKSNITHATTVVKDGGINVQSASFPSFAGSPNGSGIPLLNGNMDLLMDVPLNVTIEIGKTRKKMREIMEFGQGTIIDLEKQAGAPVDVVVNGQLIARGDVVVIDDNFGVRITEIIGNANLPNKN